MVDDSSQDQTQPTAQDTQPAVSSTDQPPVETLLAQQIPEQPPTISPDTLTNQTTQTPEANQTEQPTQNSTPPENPQPETQPAETKIETPPAGEPQTQQPEKMPTPPAETQSPVSPLVINIPALHYPFSGNFSVTFAFGQQSDNEEIKKKFQEWGIAGHNGLDFGLNVGNEVFACDSGKVIQSGDNGDFGISITIQHSWGQSLYAHLQETKVKENDEVKINQVIGLSGSSGAVFGEHLHFAIKPNNSDPNNGYLGFIDPAPFLSSPSKKEETMETPPVQPTPEETKLQQPSELEPTINIEPEKPTEQPQVVIDQAEVQKQVDEKLKTELDARRLKANQARQTRREENLMKIEKLIEEKKQINNDDLRELLHVSQSAATNYLQTLVDRGTIKKERKGKATTYHY